MSVVVLAAPPGPSAAAAGGQQPAGQLTPGGVSAHSRHSQCFGIWPSWDAIYKGRGQREIMLKTLNQQ